jgi:phospholipase/lecithinase/hemolysin
MEKFLHLLCLPFILSSLEPTQAQLLAAAKGVQALYVFGDSIVDSGNRLNTLVNATYLPYGCDFPSPASGRFTNGKTIADILSKKKQIEFVLFLALIK